MLDRYVMSVTRSTVDIKVLVSIFSGLGRVL